MDMKESELKIYETTEKGLFKKAVYKINRMYWKNKIENMSEGQVMDLYYDLTGGVR